MKTVGIITFHGAHNYGSSLQAFAMQKIYEELGTHSEIINFRTSIQKDQYAPLTKRKGLKYFLKNAFFILNYILNYKSRKSKYMKFEHFISTYLKTSKLEYNSEKELFENPPQYDLYVCGSDQIWNTAPNDASMAYFLSFIKNGRKVSFAPSFGQIGTIDHMEEISSYLSDFDMLSVREARGQELVKEMTGKDVPIFMDPTILFSASTWDKLCAPQLLNGDYIFYYSLFSTKEMIQEVKKLSKQLGIPVVISNISNQHELLNGFIQKTSSGPCEFLSLIKHAKLVVTSSFHGTIFSILYNKPFLVYKGMEDKRISTLLKTTRLEKCAFLHKEAEEKLSEIFQLDFSLANDAIKKERSRSIAYLKKTLEM